MRRNRGISTNKYISELTTYYREWIGYFYYGVINRQLEEFDGYARQRLRVILWKQWKSSKKRKKMLKKYSVSKRIIHTNESVLQLWQISTCNA